MSCECSKAQGVRLADVFLVGPIMMLGAAMLGRRAPVVALTLGALGALTIGYNGRNYLSQARREP